MDMLTSSGRRAGAYRAPDRLLGSPDFARGLCRVRMGGLFTQARSPEAEITNARTQKVWLYNSDAREDGHLLGSC